MFIWRHLFATVIWLFFTASNAATATPIPNAVSGKTYIYCFNAHWKPYDYADRGKHQGIFDDYLKLFAERLGITVVPHPTTTLTEALEAIKRGDCDFLVGAVKTAEREQYLDFTDPYFDVVHVLIGKPGRPFIGSLSSLSGKTISGPKSGAVMEWIARDYPGITFTYVETAKEAVDTILDDRVYALVTPLDVLVNENGWMLRDLNIIGKLDYPYPISIAVRKDVPGLREAFDSAIDSLSQEDRSAISKRWTTFTFVERIDYQRVLPVIILSALLIASFAFSNRRLRQEVAKRKVVEAQLIERTDNLSDALDFNKTMLIKIEQSRDELATANAELKRLAITDPLTGISNRRHFRNEVALEIARAQRYAQPLSLLLLDIDHFKAINDRHGHLTGDRVLVELSRRVGSRLRSVDRLARWGGEEFVVLMPQCDAAAAVLVAEKLRTLCAKQPFPEIGMLTASFGVAELRPGEKTEEWFSRVDVALYAAKSSGRNAVRLAA